MDTDNYRWQVAQTWYYVAVPNKTIDLKGKKMGTSAITIIKNRVLNWDTKEKEDVVVAKFYRHFDGYPSGHGADIASALADASITKPNDYIGFDGMRREENVLNNRNWCQHFLKELCKKDMDIEFTSTDDDIFTDFTYVITGEYANYGGKEDINSDEYMDRINVKVYYGDDYLLFDGSAKDYASWDRLKN